MNEKNRPANGQANGPKYSSPGAPLPATWTSREAYLLAAVCLIAGLVIGYLFRGSAGLSVATPATATMPTGQTPVQPSAPAVPPTAEQLAPLAAPMLTALKADPKNVDVLVQLGNLYYDHKVFPEAIQYYTQALALRPDNPNVRTDLGTAYWYSGNAQQAILEYDKSLKADPNHTPTLMNMGIVKMNGLNDAAGAIAAWERLLKQNPDFPEKQRVLELIAQARASKK